MTFKSNFIYTLFTILFVFSCQKEKEQTLEIFELIPEEKSGIHFKNQLEDTPELNILTYLYYYNGAGVGIADFNQDGLEDIFFASNQEKNQLFLNKGKLKFEEVGEKANITKKGWSTGVTITDVNDDGLPDIYVCQVDGLKGISGRNLLYVNQGIDENGIPNFLEKAEEYGLNFSGYSTQAAFFDADLDGDLDMYLLNHSIHPSSNYGKGSQRKVKDSISGDRFYKNNRGFFQDFTEEAGIFSSKIGFGLGLGISDLNADGYPDIYVGNDFYENDYLYLNKGDGTFEEKIHQNNKIMGHTTHFSMGNDLADFNNDGAVDILSMDMLPNDLETYKTSGNEFNYNIYQNYLKYGYHPQYMQNTLHLNGKNGYFSEIAYLSGVSASEWSWAGLWMDFDNDGLKDIFVSNGIYGATNDMDYISFISNENIQKRLSKGMTADDMEMINEIPQKKVPNYFFGNNGDLTFAKTAQGTPSFSNGAAYADLDNDGDLDLVTNNLNQVAFLYENRSEQIYTDRNFIKISFIGEEHNKLGIGAKCKIFSGDRIIFYENYPTRGYLSAVSTQLTIGVGNISQIDSLEVIWPNQKSQIIFNPALNSATIVDVRNAVLDKFIVDPFEVKNSEDNFIPNFQHTELDSQEFLREPLAPYMTSHLGPRISVIDFNNDGLDDVFIGNGKKHNAHLYLQQNNATFLLDVNNELDSISNTENNNQEFFDVDNDGDLDLLIANGGSEYVSGENLQPSLFINYDGYLKLENNRLPKIETNTSAIAINDFDKDGDLDIFLGGSSVSQKFGDTPRSYLLINESGVFRDLTSEHSQGLLYPGLVRDAVWSDLDGDQYEELIIVGHWMPLKIYRNENGILKEITTDFLSRTNGLYNVVVPFDIDNDGDTDLILGNWGLNSRLHASYEEPMSLYINDFDKNGTEEPVMTYFSDGNEIVFANKDELTKQIPSLNKRFLSYRSFAKAGFEDIFKKDLINSSKVKYVYNLASILIKNEGDFNFKIHNLPKFAQISPLHAVFVDDLDKDGNVDVIIGGNDTQLNTQLGQLDASKGQVLTIDQKGNFEINMKLTKNISVSGAIRDIKSLKIGGRGYLVIARNNQNLVWIKED
ncbi:VCBS repeat-containing protein [Namhaeicola litoreus]|uniref:VCBS repeat-containing protein n=1 Tax=Namhaeicola litoreus TaxID=1052145 RepID=A0ABW3Y069_9FLAO